MTKFKLLIFLALPQTLPEHRQTPSIVMSVSLHIQQNNRVTNFSSHRARVLVNVYRHKLLALLQYLNSENVCHVNVCIEKKCPKGNLHQFNSLPLMLNK